jgi:hypothetical protein
MIAHSAFIIVSRKLVADASSSQEHAQESLVADDSRESEGVNGDEPLD